MLVTSNQRVEASALRDTLDELRTALNRPPISTLASDAFGHDRSKIAASLHLLLAGIDGVDLNAVRSLSGLVREYRPQSQANELRELFASLKQGWRELITRTLGEPKLLVLKRLLDSPTPDVLRILGREDDENAHSDLVAYLLSPQRAPNIAGHALLSLIETLDAPTWHPAVNAAIASGLVSVRREMRIGRDLVGNDDLCRVDIVISGPGFVLAIENKVWAHEHWDQTTLYWRWLEQLQSKECLRAGIFLSPSGMTCSCPSFTPVSFLRLVSALLEAPTRSVINPSEEIVLASYLKTLARYILPVEMNAAVRAARALEGT